MDAPKDELLTPLEVAKILNVKTETVFRRFSEEPGIIDLSAKDKRVPGRRRRRFIRIPKSVLDRFLHSHRVR